MEQSLKICEQLCRACRSTNQEFYHLCHKVADHSLTFNEMLAATIPQVPVHPNDELPKQICAACADTLLNLYKFQQMVIASDTYLRSLLVSKSLKIDRTSEEEEMKQTEMVQVKVENDYYEILSKSEPTEERDDDHVHSDWSKIDNEPLSKCRSHKINFQAAEEFLKLEVDAEQVQKCVFNSKLRNENELVAPSQISDLSSANECNRNQRKRHHKCDHCPKIFATKQSLKRHQPKHSDANKCKHCEKTFSSYSYLKAHLSTHTGDKPFKCKLCEKSFAFKSTLAYHMQTHVKRSYTCDECNILCTSKSALIIHQRTHTGEGAYKCKSCEKLFISKRSRANHARKHNVEQVLRYKCEVCKKAFDTKSHLTRHIHGNCKGKPHKCNRCEKAYVNAASLLYHTRVHTGERPYKCDKCNKRGKHKNSRQEKIMIEFMEEHEDIARGFTKGDRVVIDQLWKDLAEQLNSHGPPMKDSNGWKKVWSDWKCCIRKKLCHNRKEDRATGGGLFNKYTLSDMEDTVARLAGIYTVVGGVSNSSSIGCGEVIELPFSEEDHQSSSLRELEMPSMQLH